MNVGSFDTKNPAHRQALVNALGARGIRAYEKENAVRVDLLHQGQDWLTVTTANEQTPCDVGMLGRHGEKEAGTDFLNHPEDLDTATALFEWHWEDRASWIDMFHAGALDYGKENTYACSTR